MNYEPNFLMQPVLFQRRSRGKWEEGVLYIFLASETEKIFDKNNREVESCVKHKPNWKWK